MSSDDPWRCAAMLTGSPPREMGQVDGGGQGLVVGIDDEHRQQPSLGGARIPADGMAGSGRLVEALFGVVDPFGPVVHLRFDRARDDIGVDERRFRMGVRRRSRARRIVDEDGDQRLARNVGDRMLEIRRDGLALILPAAGVAMAMQAAAMTDLMIMAVVSPSTA